MITMLEEEGKDVTPQQPPPTNLNDIMVAISPMMRQLERLDERSRDLATRSDLETLRKDLVARDSFEALMNGLKTQITRVDTDRVADKAATENRIDRLEQDQITRQDRLWIRLGQIAGLAALALTLFEILSHVKWLP